MVQLMKSECLKKVKLELDDSLEDQLGPLHKRSKLDSSNKWSSSYDSFPIPPTEYNPLEEPSPLGLRLRKSPSLLDLIQMRLSQENTSKVATVNKKDRKGNKASGTMDNKLKASNFPASILRIGSWEYKSRYEGDLVGKCYFAKHKLVWEVLDGCLKNKIEIQWSDIAALKANYPEDGPGTLDVVLGKRPLFYRETNPQPRKHTLWQATSDFTGGQASINRRHFLQCPQGLLGKHFEKLIQCDPRLNFLNQQPEIVLDCPYFEAGVKVVDDPTESSDGFDRREEELGFFGWQSVASPSGSQSTSSRNEQDFVSKVTENISRETVSPSSVMGTNVIEEFRSSRGDNLKLLSTLDQIKVPGIHPSMSMSDLVSHIGHCISEQMTSGNPTFAGDSQHRAMLEEITQYLFNDSQLTSTSDEQFLMKKVDSLCCLLQKDPSTAQNLQVKAGNGLGGNGDTRVGERDSILVSPSKSKTAENEGELDYTCGRKQATGMSRKESFGELLLNLPRIASLPQFLFNLTEDSNNKAR
ncbi:ATP-dependent DNA helicase [Quillaja saponaria]|uniref:ATP-dependent DNA helicase n=1 Tax=Quillaja saponaria TaxID=32244 RepID=A0AAD7PNW3_QUISA|nr:ATP-dependent DNA helicase [Quillaja saponaria]KAJ7962727.1 ATP-dependent DNA helicase [Quillaja saponaria]